MPPWYFQHLKNWVIFSPVEKNCQKKKEIKNRSTPPIIRKDFFSQIHVPGYMDLKKKQNSMYPGTWIWRRNKIPCTRVHEFEEKTMIFVQKMRMKREEHYSVYRAILRAPHKGVDRVFYFLFFWQLFSTWEKITQFFEFCKDQGGKI